MNKVASRFRFIALTVPLLCFGGKAWAITSTADTDFQARCSAPGVRVCEGFDNASTFVPVTTGVGLYPANAGAGPLRGFQDTSILASGASSLRFDILGKTGSDTAGLFWASVGQSFGQNSTFYVQWRQRLSPEMLTNDWLGQMGTYWKQAGFHGKAGGTCQATALVIINLYNQGIPAMYSECGGRSLYTTLDRSSWTANTPLLLQQGTSGTDGYNCEYGVGDPAGTGDGQGCFKYPSNKWITFYYKVQIGTWGQANSKVQAWISVDGQPYKQWINVPNYTLNNAYQSQDNNFSLIALTPYMTGKNSSIDHPTAHTWYDELLVSTQPIAAPGNVNPPSGSLAAPQNLRVTTN